MKYAYDIIVIGEDFGAEQITARLSHLGARVAHVKKGENTQNEERTLRMVVHVLRRIAKWVALSRNPKFFGIEARDFQLDVTQLQKYVVDVLRGLKHEREHESLRTSGVDLFYGDPVFFSPHHLAVSTQEAPIALSAKKFLLATGTLPALPFIAGLDQIQYYTGETLLSMPFLPKTLAIIGGAETALELAQVYARLGCQVTLLWQGDSLLPKTDDLLNEQAERVLLDEGVKLLLQVDVQRIEQGETGKRLLYKSKGMILEMESEEILFLTRPLPSIAGLGLNEAGVEHSSQGIHVDCHLRTSARHIYAMGMATDQKFAILGTMEQFQNLAENLNGTWQKKLQHLTVPERVYLDPEIAFIGKSEKEASQAKHPFTVETLPFHSTLFPHLEDAFEGSVRLIRNRSGKAIGGQAFGAGAVQVLHELFRNL